LTLLKKYSNTWQAGPQIEAVMFLIGLLYKLNL